MFLINEEYKCLEPGPVLEFLQNIGAPQTLIDTVAKANTYTVSHGIVPNAGYFLISRNDYYDLTEGISTGDGIDNLADVKLKIQKASIADPKSKDSILFEKLTVTNAINVIGPKDGNNSVFLIKLEDIRYWMQKFYCHNIKRNFIATNNDFVNDWLQKNTTNGIEFWTITDILEELVDKFAQDSGIDTEALGTTYSDYMHNVEFHDHTVLEAIGKICEAQRIHMQISRNGKVMFGDGEEEWPTPSDLNRFAITEEDSPSVYPSNITVICEKEKYSLYDDRCENDRPDGTFTYDHETSFVDGTTTEAITVPYLFQSDYLNNNTSIEGILANVAARYEDIRNINSRADYWRGVQDIDELVGFGVDKVVYTNRGAGMVTVAVAVPLGDQSLNYRNPEFPKYHEDPHGMWLYRFTLKEDWENQEALSDIYRHSGEDTGYDEYVKDPFDIFQDMTVGDSGWCLELCDKYYAIQAPCYDGLASVSTGGTSVPDGDGGGGDPEPPPP